MAADDKPRGGGALQRLVLWVVIAALFATVWWLASERNQRHYRVSTANGQMVIEQGRFFPIGTSPSQDKVYAPVAVPPGETGPGELEFDGQNALDRWLFNALSQWAKSAVKKDDTPTAAALADRASQLPGLTGAQVAELTSLKADLAWDDARDNVAKAAGLVDAAVRDLMAVAAGKGARSLDAAQEAERLRGIAQGLRAGVKPSAPPPAAPAAAPPAQPAK